MEFIRTCFGYFKLLAIPIVLFAGLITLCYFRICKKQGRKIEKHYYVWLVEVCLLTCYLIILFCVTLLNRGGITVEREIMPLFYSYKEAWIKWSSIGWRNIVLNYCVFIPLGFLLPCILNFFKKGYRTYLAGFLLTIAIEITQYIFYIGVFEFDDILGNTVGTMIGYGFWSLTDYTKSLFIKDSKDIYTEKRNISRIIRMQIPLLLTFTLFLSINIAYACEPLGHNSYRPVDTLDPESIFVSAECILPDSTECYPVYKTDKLSKKEAKHFCRELKTKYCPGEKAGKFESLDDAIIYSDGKNYRISYNLKTAYWGYFNPEKYMSGEECLVGLSEEDLLPLLKEYDISVLDEATIAEVNPGRYLADYNMVKSGENIIDGTLSVQFTSDKELMRIDDYTAIFSVYKECQAISAESALDKIKNGEFIWYDNELLFIDVTGCSLKYYFDSKGYYQPNYEFNCKINGAENTIIIPALS